MITIGYEYPDGSVKYLLTSDDLLESVISTYVYSNRDFDSIKPWGRDEIRMAENVDSYLKRGTNNNEDDYEDTRFRFLKKANSVWMIRDSYGSKVHDMVFTRVSGGKTRHKQTRRKNKRFLIDLGKKNEFKNNHYNLFKKANGTASRRTRH